MKFFVQSPRQYWKIVQSCPAWQSIQSRPCWWYGLLRSRSGMRHFKKFVFENPYNLHWLLVQTYSFTQQMIIYRPDDDPRPTFIWHLPNVACHMVSSVLGSMDHVTFMSILWHTNWLSSILHKPPISICYFSKMNYGLQGCFWRIHKLWKIFMAGMLRSASREYVPNQTNWPDFTTKWQIFILFLGAEWGLT